MATCRGDSLAEPLEPQIDADLPELTRGLICDNPHRTGACANEDTMRLDEARGLIMQALRETGWNQVDGLTRAAGDIKARSQGINPNVRPGYNGGRRFLERGDETLFVEVIWSLIIQGILVPGLDDSNQGWPFLPTDRIWEAVHRSRTSTSARP